MYKVISNIDYGVILETKNWEEAKLIALKYEATVYKNGRLHQNFGGNENVGGRKKLLRVCNKANKRNAGRYKRV